MGWGWVGGLEGGAWPAGCSCSRRRPCLPSPANGLWGALEAAGWAPGILRLGPFPQLDRWKQGQALARLRQRMETEVWETQKALDELLFKCQLQVSRAMPRRTRMPTPCPGAQGSTPLPRETCGPWKMDATLLLRGGCLPLQKVKLGRVQTCCLLKRGPCLSLTEESAAAFQRSVDRLRVTLSLERVLGAPGWGDR